MKWNRTTAKEYWGFVDEVPPPELVAALKDESLPVRMAATQALARFHLGLDSAIPTLFAMLDDPEPTIRRAAERTLGAAWPTPVVVPTLIEALRSKNQAVRYGSVQMLNRIEIESNANEAVPLLTAILKEPPRSTPDPDMTVVFGFSNDRSPTRGAAIALGRIAPNETTVALFIEILSTGKPDEPGVAQRWIDSAEGLLQMGPKAVTAVPALIAALDQLLDSKKPMPGLYPLVDAIGRFAPDSSSAVGAVDVLTRLLEPKYQAWYPDARSLAIEIMGRFGRAAAVAIPKLRALQRENDAVGTAAAAALAAIEADLKHNSLRGHSR